MIKEEHRSIAVILFFIFIIICICFISCDMKKEKEDSNTPISNINSNEQKIEEIEDAEPVEVIKKADPTSNSVSNSNKTSNKGNSNKTSNKSNSNNNSVVPVSYYVASIPTNKIYVGNTTKVSVTIKPENATNKEVKYSSSNPKVATISNDGTIRGISAGTCEITVNVSNAGISTMKIQVLAKPTSTSNSNSQSNNTSNSQSNNNANKVIKVTGVSLDKNSINVSVGKTVTLKATISPSNATNKGVTWSSSNTSVATVSNTGVVTGKKIGTTTITVKTKDGSKIATAKVNVVQYKTFTATFVNNGANSISSGKMSCTTTGTSCTITTPRISRGGWNILGWNTNSNAKTAQVGAGKTVTLTKNTTYYAITSKLITGTFIRTGCSATTTVKRTCTAYNKTKTCKIAIPTCEKTGVYDNVWSMNKNGTGNLYVVNQIIDISGDYVYYPAFKHPYANIVSTNERNSVKIRNFKIAKTYKVGSTRFEYQSGIPTSAITKHYNFLKKVYSQIPYIFVPGKVFVMTESTYNNYSKAYGLTTYSGSIAFIDLKYDTSIGAISPNATIHELTHGWDGYYNFKTGSGLSSKSDIVSFYNGLGAKKRNNLAINEWLAALVPDYYWQYLKNDTSENSYSGYKANFTSAEKTKAVNLLKKYFKIASNGYK